MIVHRFPLGQPDAAGDGELAVADCGSGPVLLLVHGLASSRATWTPVIDLLAADFRVLAVDLPGCGTSGDGTGDRSLGAAATVLRDALIALDIPAATVVGHSMGGGVAMSFAYQFPSHCERLILVASGGLGREVSPLLRVATLPGAGPVLARLARPRVRAALAAIGTCTHLAAAADAAQGLGELADPHARETFLRTLRGVVGLGGQEVSALGLLSLATLLPTCVIWGGRDSLLPVAHAARVAERVPGAQLEIFAEAGHFPHHDAPERFAETVREFCRAHPPAHLDEVSARTSTRDASFRAKPTRDASFRANSTRDGATRAAHSGRGTAGA